MDLASEQTPPFAGNRSNGLEYIHMIKEYPHLTIHTDGGSRGNPGPAAIGVVITAADQEIALLSESIGRATNNVAEYTAVLRAVEYLKANQIKTPVLKFVLDSELIVKQITGIYKIKQPHLLTLKLKISEILNELRKTEMLSSISFSHVLRHLNKKADLLVNQALDN